MSEEPRLEELDRLIAIGKQKGFLTYDEVNDALPSDIVSLDQLDDIMIDVREPWTSRWSTPPRPAACPRRSSSGRRPWRTTTMEAAGHHRPDPRPRGADRGSRCASTCARWGASLSSPARARSTLAKRIEEGEEQVTRAMPLHEPRPRALPRTARPAQPQRDLRQGEWSTSTRRSPATRRPRPWPARSSRASPRSTDLLRERDRLRERAASSASRARQEEGEGARSRRGSAWTGRPSSGRPRCWRPCAR